ncbi:MAG TPA: peroxiredoxin [Rhodocyclaceae bacterium]|nr:peroxiredoxin [Rhodocyclaceae bacterium]
MLQPGQLAPMFSLPDADMETFDLKSLRGKHHAVIFFYPKDGTPFCTREAIEFSDHETEFNRQHCVIVGISRDDCLAHADFRDKNGLSVRLLADVDGKVGHQYGVYQYREHEGQRKLCVLRSTFVVDKNGVVRYALYEVPNKGHAAEVFKLVKQLNGSHHSCKSPKTR